MSPQSDFQDAVGGSSDSAYEVSDEGQPSGSARVPTDPFSDIRPVRSRDEALDGGLPLLMLHKEARYFNRLSGLIDEMHLTHSPSMSFAAVLNLPRVKPDGALNWLGAPSGASVRIADPELYSRDDMWGGDLLEERDGPPRPDEPGRPLMPQTTASRWAFWNRDLPFGPTEDWVQETLDAQREVGANLLLTPGAPLNQHNPGPSLEAQERHVDWARAALGTSERLAVNVTIDGAWLASPALRSRLLTTIVDSDESTWYVRVKWPFAPSHSQLIDAAILDGYRELAAVMDDEERVLLLPNTGGTGWVSLAWGATGFGTGMGNNARGFTTGRPIRRRAPAAAPPPRYYERALLHTVERPTSDALSRIPGYTPCACTHCGLLRDVPNWDEELSSSHYLRAVAGDTAAVGQAAGRRRAARRIVRTARQTRDRVATIVPLTDRDAPVHLRLWEERLL